MSTKDRSDFLGRWSRLKRTRADEPDEPEAPPAEAAPVEEPAPEPKTEAEILEELGLPDPESLEPGDDFAAFMAKAVPEHLRRRALRKLWTSNPVLACLDDLVDYADDYSDAAVAVETLSTGFRVGSGFVVRTREAREQVEKVAAAVAPDEESPAAGPDSPAAGLGPPPEPHAPADAPEEQETDEAEPDAPSRTASTTPERRLPARMRFRQMDS